MPEQIPNTNTPPPILQTQIVKKPNFFHRHLLAEILSLFLVAATVAVIYYILSSVPVVEIQQVVHKEKMDSIANWKTYANSQYGFEFKYPDNFNNFKEDPSDSYVGGAESKNGIIDVWVAPKKFDPNLVTDASGAKIKTQPVKIGNQDGYMYYSTDEGCGGHIVQTALNNQTLQVNFVSCVTDQKPYLAEDQTNLTPLEIQILSTFKFTDLNSRMNADLLPLYNKCMWSVPIIAKQEYSFFKNNEYELIQLPGYQISCNKVDSDFETYYDQKLKNLGWQEDLTTEADGAGGSQWGYIKNGKHIIFNIRNSQAIIFSD